MYQKLCVHDFASAEYGKINDTFVKSVQFVLLTLIQCFRKHHTSTHPTFDSAV